MRLELGETDMRDGPVTDRTRDKAARGTIDRRTGTGGSKEEVNVAKEAISNLRSR